MPDLILYLLKANVALVLFYLAYHLVLRKLTFYHLNRLFLVFGIVFSAVYPFIDLTELLGRHEELAGIHTYAVAIPAWTATAIPEQEAAFDYWLIPGALFWLGCAIMLLRLMLQFVSLHRIHRASVPASYQGVDFRKTSGISEAFSFWKTIYLNPTQHRSPELEAILRHEQIHVKGWHTLDVLLAELSTVLYWFNPGVWLMKQAVKENLEFIADQHVVDAGVDRKEYQYLLLKVVGATQPQIANQFNFPSLKRRIAMMNEMPTSRANRLRLLVVLPLVAVLLVAFRGTSQDSIATLTEAILPGEVTQTPASSTEDYEAFFKRNLDVRSIHWVPNYSTANYGSDSHEVKRLVVARYNVVQSYRLNQEGDMTKAANEYGELPNTPAKPTSLENPYFEGAQQLEKTDEYAAFYARNPEVKRIYWRSNARIVVALKSGAEEVYTFGDKQSIAAAKQKYGEMPSNPPVVRRDSLDQEARAKSNLPAEGLYFIDGVESTREAAEKLDPKGIHSVHVIKGDHATNTFGNKEAKGVISIVTEKNKDSRQVQEFNKKLKHLVPPPPAAPEAPGTPPPPPSPDKEQLPPPPPPVRYDGPAIPKAGESRVVETEEYIAYFIWPEDITTQEVRTAKITFNNNGMALNFIEEHDGDRLVSLKITVISPKGVMANAAYNAEALKSIVDAENIIVVHNNKRTGEVRIATLFR